MSNDAEMLFDKLTCASSENLLEILQQHARSNGSHLSRIIPGGLIVRWARVYEHRQGLKKILWFAQNLTGVYHHTLAGYFATMAELMRSQEYFEASAIILSNPDDDRPLAYMKEHRLKADAFIAYQPGIRNRIAAFYPDAEMLFPQVPAPSSASAMAEIYKPLPVAYSGIKTDKPALHHKEG